MRLPTLIACAMMSGAAAPSPPPSDSQPTDRGAEAKGAEENSAPSTLVAVPAALQKVEKAPSAKPSAKGNGGQAERPNWTEVGSFWAGIAQAVIGFTGLVGLAFTVLYAKRAWKAAEKSAKAADDTFKAAVASEQRELRAYVHPDGFVPRPETRKLGEKPVPGIVINVTWKNFGLTPTRRLHTGSGWKLFEGPVPDGFDFPEGRGSARKSVSLGPSAHFYDTVFVSFETLRKAQLPGNRYYVWFWIEYSDVFEGTPRHRTEVCVSVRFDGDPATSKPLWEAVPAFSNADEDCRQKPKTTGFES